MSAAAGNGSTDFQFGQDSVLPKETVTATDNNAEQLANFSNKVGGKRRKHRGGNPLALTSSDYASTQSATQKSCGGRRRKKKHHGGSSLTFSDFSSSQSATPKAIGGRHKKKHYGGSSLTFSDFSSSQSATPKAIGGRRSRKSGKKQHGGNALAPADYASAGPEIKHIASESVDVKIMGGRRRTARRHSHRNKKTAKKMFGNLLNMFKSK